MVDILPDILKRKRTRRKFIKKDIPVGIAVTVVSIASLGVAVKTGFDALSNDNPDEIEEGRRKQKTPEQKEAYEKLIKNSGQYEFVVEDTEEIRSAGGVTVRNRPLVPPTEREDINASRSLTSLSPKTHIKNAIYVEGSDPNLGGIPGVKASWAAFILDTGEVGFVAGKYLKSVVPQTYSR